MEGIFWNELVFKLRKKLQDYVLSTRLHIWWVNCLSWNKVKRGREEEEEKKKDTPEVRDVERSKDRGWKKERGRKSREQHQSHKGTPKSISSVKVALCSDPHSKHWKSQYNKLDPLIRLDFPFTTPLTRAYSGIYLLHSISCIWLWIFSLGRDHLRFVSRGYLILEIEMILRWFQNYLRKFTKYESEGMTN